ncbi:DUF5700 domain-containing putative Zn-dependent protease [Viridibacillus sp. NPDC093762]|uniref:DUF5700 domain-containing putative Zn-dependent protease n=1 Tax=Viridibacillus sp. NPDC093762 TaxID=3390720 RepID=UPI003CFD2167
MKRVAKFLPSIIQDVYEQMSTMLGIQMDLRVKILVGGFGSNAYVTHDGTIHFAIETITDEPKHLRVLVAHEMAHSFHFTKLKMDGFDFSKMAWDGYTSLYLEGIATFLSEFLNPELPESVYLSFDDKSEEWINYFHKNYADIIFSLEEDLKN